MVGSKGHLTARTYLRGELEALAADSQASFSVQEFDPDVDAGVAHLKRAQESSLKALVSAARERGSQKGLNLIIDFKGEGAETILLCAHYDNLAFNDQEELDPESLSPGADYNASGVAIALGISKLLAGMKLNKSVRIVFLDWQGLGLLGSKAYAAYAKQDQSATFVGAVNLEMLGHDSKTFDEQEKYGNMKVYLRSEAKDPEGSDVKLLADFSRVAQKLAKGRPDFAPERNDFAKLDSFRFWEAGIPALSFSQNWESDKNPSVWSKSDFPETLNQSTLYQAFTYLAYAVIGWANEIP